MSKKILIVDDHPDTVLLFSMVLEKAGYEVLSAADGEEGYRKAVEARPDLILLDIMMPIMDGYTMNRCLKQNPQVAQIPVIVISGKTRVPVWKEDPSGEAINGYLVKPFTGQVLLTKIEELFSLTG